MTGVWEQLAHDPNETVRAWTAERCTNPVIVAEMTKDKNPDVRAAAARNLYLDKAHFPALASDDEPHVVSALARRLDLDVRLFQDLATHPSPRVRACIASNPVVPCDVLHALAHDPDPLVRAKAAENIKLNDRDRIALLHDSEPRVRLSALVNKRIYAEQAMAAAFQLGIPWPEARSRCVLYPQTAAWLVMACDSDPEVRAACALMCTWEHILKRLLQDPDERVYKAALSNFLLDQNADAASEPLEHTTQAHKTQAISLDV